jgi:hypothetical protein
MVANIRAIMMCYILSSNDIDNSFKFTENRKESIVVAIFKF